MNYYGMLIRQERLRRDWSQKGLCRGICTVSYLSKIEQGKAEPSAEIYRLLLSRLGLVPGEDQEAEAAVEAAYELLFSGNMDAFRTAVREFRYEEFRITSVGLDVELQLRLFAEQGQRQEPLALELEICMDSRQLALQRILQERYEEAIRLLPNSYCYYCAGSQMYGRGKTASALEYLQRSYDLAALEGALWTMLNVRVLMGNCYSNQRDLENMMAHYRVAKRMAQALHSEKSLQDMEYNIASTQLECGQYEEAYRYFSTREAPWLMALHKLAVCCEQMGKRREALLALNQAETMECEMPPTMLARAMCSLVRFRLEHSDYCRRAEYGEALLSCFEQCRRELPIGYAMFHLPWVLEWYTTSRQYKRGCELLLEFFGTCSADIHYNFLKNRDKCD